MASPEAKTRILLIGIDGASFNLIERWLERGLLPNFSRLIAEGVCGEMESCIPPVTMPAWRVFSSGKYPGKLGVFWQQQLDMRTMNVFTPNGTHFETADYWDYLNRAGLRTGIVGMPDTYPPRPLDGFMVSAGPSSADDGYTYPEDIAHEIESQVGFQLNVRGDFYHAHKDSPVVAEAQRVVDRTFASAEYLAERRPVEVLQVTTFDIVRLEHFFFDDEPTLRAWQIADGWLGKWRPQFDYTLVLSDHGTEEVKRAFFLNAWLRQNGYLRTKRHPLDILPKLGITRTTIAAVMQRLGLLRMFSFETLLKYASMLPGSTGVFGDFGNQAVVRRVDWPHTTAFALPQGPLYINRGALSGDDEYEALRERLVREIESLADPDSGQRVVRKVYRREELYSGAYLEQAPDLVVLTDDAYHNRAGLAQPEPFSKSWKWRGNNRLHGLFMLAGPGIGASRKLDGVRIVDLAPTILHLAGVAVPQDMDGCVLQRAFAPESELARREVTYQQPLVAGTQSRLDDVEQYDETVSRRLKDLGYL